jgi:hypothetical protein
MRMRARLVALALTPVAAGCIGSGSAAHAPLSAAQALHQVRVDGFTGATRTTSPASWRCTASLVQNGPPNPTGQYAAYKRAVYAVQFGDRRVPPTSNNTGLLAMVVVVFGDPHLAARCAQGGMYTDEHHSPPSRYKVIAASTVEMNMHKRDAPGVIAGTDGTYDTYLARGRVLALGLAYNEDDSQIVRADLARIVRQISG